MELMDRFIEKETGAYKPEVYVSGLSMGGMGTFEILCRSAPTCFAAATPICGNGVAADG
jgi:predicted peptidase